MVGSERSCGFAAVITVAICGFLVGVCGTIAYFAEQYKIKYYTGAHCFVTYSDVIYDCNHASRSSSGRVSSRNCHYYSYWKVEYYVPAMHKEINSNIQGHFGTTRTAALNSAHLDHPFTRIVRAGMIIHPIPRILFIKSNGKNRTISVGSLCFVLGTESLL